MKKFAGVRAVAATLVTVIVVSLSATAFAQPPARGIRSPRQSDPVSRLVLIVKRAFSAIVDGDMITTPKP